jgi:hypothetical protein
LAKWRREGLLNNITLLVGTETHLLSKHSYLSPSAFDAGEHYAPAFRPNGADQLTIVDTPSGGQSQFPFAHR